MTVTACVSKAAAFIQGRLGRRGAILTALGVIWVLTGVSTVIEAPIPGTEQLLFALIPQPVRFLLWCGTGLIAIVWAWMPPRRSDTIGWMALYLMPAVRTVSYMFGWIASLGGDDGWSPPDWLHHIPYAVEVFAFFARAMYSRGWPSALVWAGFMAVILIASSWPEPQEAKRYTRPTAEGESTP